MVIDARNNGFSLVELSVALAIIAAGIIGTISLIGVNQVFLEKAWRQVQLDYAASSVLTEIAAKYRRGDGLQTVGFYDFVADRQNFNLRDILEDNDLSVAAARLTIDSGVPPVAFEITFSLYASSQQVISRKMLLYTPLAPPLMPPALPENLGPEDPVPDGRDEDAPPPPPEREEPRLP